MEIITLNKHKEIKADYVLKDIKIEDRASLPPKMKVFLWLHMKELTMPSGIYKDCRENYPEYFEE